MDPKLQSQIDQAMIDLDKTEKKNELGVNAILAVSMAACKAGAAEKEVPLCKHLSDLSGRANMVLPVAAFTVLSGGKHASNTVAIQEIMILAIGASRFEEALQWGSETYHHLKAVITKKTGVGCNVADFDNNLNSKYLLESYPSPKNIEEFCSGLAHGTVSRYYRSQPVPDNENASIVTVVGKTYEFCFLSTKS